MNIIGIFMEGPNTGACLFSNGKLIAMAEEERFIRQKSASEMFPASSIRYCLSEGGITLKDVSTISLAWDHSKYPDDMNRFMKSIPGRELDVMADRFEGIIHEKLSADATLFNVKTALKRIDQDAEPEIVWFSHHKCHAASTHFLSDFDESAVLIMDGSGEELATTIWHGKQDTLEVVGEWALPHSLGWFYAAITEWLGFKAYSGEGKVMGLAAYGKARPEVAEKLRQFCIPDEKGGYRLDPTFVYYGPRNYSRKFTDKLVDLLGSPRLPEAELSDYHIDIAFEAQKLLEEIASALANQVLEKTGSRNLCIGGGVAMNCKMNGALSNLENVDAVFVNPASHDSGAAMGAALLAGAENNVAPNQSVLTHAYWGPSFSENQIEEALEHCGLRYSKPDSIADEVAMHLSEGKIVGWFQGRAEFGARALGGRSILANPMLPNMKEKINAQVKYREAFRPFAPSMIMEVKDKYMVESKDSPFMILAYQFKDEFKKLFPSIVHVDGSVRPQTVDSKTNPLYWEMINAFGKLTGHPIVLNTSFNVRGEPVVNTPLDAVRCFYSTGMDIMALGPFIVTK